MNKYKVLLEIEELKLGFISDLLILFSPDIYKNGNLIAFTTRKYKNIPYNTQYLLGLREEEHALISKLCHIIFNRGGFKPALEMLKSFKRGVKALGDDKNEYSHERRYAWTTKDGNDKLSHGKNLPKAHFRWNEGKRYILSSEQIYKIEHLIKDL